MIQGLQILLPKKKARSGGTAYTPTFKVGNDTLSVPTYKDHLTDLFSSRGSDDSRSLMTTLSRHDSDVSAAFFAYQSIAGSAKFTVAAYDMDGQLSTDGIATANAILQQVTTVTDYTLGFSPKASMRQLCDDMRFYTLLRGSPGVELVYDKRLQPDSLRLVDMGGIEWHEAAPGQYKPLQKPSGSSTNIDLNIPTFFMARFAQNPTDVYSYSPFVAAINTIAARVQVINELYRITQILGYPRMDVTVLEEVLLKSAPPLLRTDQQKTREFLDTQIASIRTAFRTMKSDETLVHTDAVKVGMVNDKAPVASLPIANVIDILDQQNQAALKTMPAVIGKSNNGQVASVEARLFAMNCDALNAVVADVWSQLLTLASRLAGFQGRVEMTFEPVELRPQLELEPQRTMKQSRWEQALSRGYVTDDEFHLAVFGRPRPQQAPELSGTNFLDAAKETAASVDATGVTPNADPMGQSLAPAGGTKVARSNSVKSTPASRSKQNA